MGAVSNAAYNGTPPLHITSHFTSAAAYYTSQTAERHQRTVEPSLEAAMARSWRELLDLVHDVESSLGVPDHPQIQFKAWDMAQQWMGILPPSDPPEELTRQAPVLEKQTCCIGRRSNRRRAPAAEACRRPPDSAAAWQRVPSPLLRPPVAVCTATEIAVLISAACSVFSGLASRLAEVTAAAKREVQQGGAVAPRRAFQMEAVCRCLGAIMCLLERRLLVLPEPACMRALAAASECWRAVCLGWRLAFCCVCIWPRLKIPSYQRASLPACLPACLLAVLPVHSCPTGAHTGPPAAWHRCAG